MKESVLAALADELIVIALLLIVASILLHYGMPWYVLVPVSAVTGFLAILLIKGILVQLKKPAVGPESLVGKTAIVVDFEDSMLLVKLEGELWRAECSSTKTRCEKGSLVKIVGVKGLTLFVEPLSSKKNWGNTMQVE